MESRAASEREESRHGNITNNDESAIPGTYIGTYMYYLQNWTGRVTKIYHWKYLI